MKFLLGLFSLSFIGVFIIALAISVTVYMVTKAGPLTDSTIIEIEYGQGVRQIAKNLQDGAIIENQYPFLIGAKIKNSGAPLQAGEYEIPAYASMATILNMMQRGQVIQRQLTIPEGLTSWEIVQMINKAEPLSGEVATIPAEGSLMPDTYNYMKGEPRQDIINRMQASMNDFMVTLNMSLLESSPLKNKDDVLILASIVEKETAIADEYARVAGVFINRLNIGMPLQTDPTVIYGITKGEHAANGMGPLGRRLLSKDLKADTPYNTYTRQGLPPTPICNPGRAAILAVLSPESHQYLYFVANGTGGHAFSTNLADHNANVTKWRQLR